MLGREEVFFVKDHYYAKSNYSEDEMIEMLEFQVDKTSGSAINFILTN